MTTAAALALTTAPRRSEHAQEASELTITESMPVSATPTLNDASQTQPQAQLQPHLRLSHTFSVMADQIAAASQALAAASPGLSETAAGEVTTLKARLEAIESTQERLGADMEALKGQIAKLAGGGGAANGLSSGVVNGATNGAEEGGEEGGEPPKDPAIEALEKKIADLAEVVRLEQERLPARLHNSRATYLKYAIKQPVTPNGKPAPNFPTSRGEFEHITKERYEAILKAYGVPAKGDTDAKREAVRKFIGLPEDNL